MPSAPLPARRSAFPRLRRLRRSSLVLLALGLGALAEPAASETVERACPPREGRSSPEPAEWNRQHVLLAASNAAGVGDAALKPGAAVRAVLRRDRAVDFLAKPGKPSRPGQFGGMFRVRIERPGAYRVMLDSKAWLDVLKDGVAVAPIGHGPGPACSRVRKTVDFQLSRGDHLLQLSASPSSTAVILIMPSANLGPDRHGAALAPPDHNTRGDMRR